MYKILRGLKLLDPFSVMGNINKIYGKYQLKNCHKTCLSMRSLARRIVQGSKEVQIRETRFFTIQDKTMKNVMELMGFELGILRSPS